MVDLSSSGAAFLAPANSPIWPGKRLSLRITHPMLQDGFFSICNVHREAEVLRVDSHTAGTNKVAVRLLVPLDYDPAGNASGIAGVTVH